ncbi:hypothetical protein [Halomonas sp. LBP4]|uniref:hypothetical protein n=1 Tax=Halomonas sp. LBP4 TaxID=2044917 RepID=UPI000D75989E|nr:hypothetical protein [Halomonas sp. LBP4]PXX96671.1 hypothetical protein CR157_15870 [Halomonas sp. LBP4]
MASKQPPFCSLADIPYLDASALHGRVAHLMPFWDGEEWHLWVPEGDRGLMHLRPADAAHIDYVAKEPASQSDLLIPFVDFMWQHAGWPDVYPTISAIIDDFHNLATSVAKIDHFFEVRETLGIGGTAFVATELEYLFVLSRSVFDLLQFAIASIWDKHIQLVDEEANRRKRRPKESFTKVVLKERKQPRTQAELMEANGFTPALASTYEKVAPFFIQILNARDGIIHGNKSAGSLTPVYDTERGWCVHRKAKGISEFSVWTDEHRYNDNLVSLRPLLAHVVFGTISACGELVTSLARDIQFPPPIAPGHRIFVRGFHNEAITRLWEVHQGGSAWWASEKTATEPAG